MTKIAGKPATILHPRAVLLAGDCGADDEPNRINAARGWPS